MSDIAAWAPLVAAIASLLAALVGIVGLLLTRSLHVDIDGRMEQLLEARGEAAEAKGVARERSEARHRSVSEAEDAARVRALDATEQPPKDAT